MDLSVREIQYSDIDALVDYWMSAEDSFLEGMGVDLKKMPDRDGWVNTSQHPAG